MDDLYNFIEKGIESLKNSFAVECKRVILNYSTSLKTNSNYKFKPNIPKDFYGDNSNLMSAKYD